MSLSPQLLVSIAIGRVHLITHMDLNLPTKQISTIRHMVTVKLHPIPTQEEEWLEISMAVKSILRKAQTTTVCSQVNRKIKELALKTT
jgi:hypothetical protein